MALIECYECSTQISAAAPACPKCGAPKKKDPEATAAPVGSFFDPSAPLQAKTSRRVLAIVGIPVCLLLLLKACAAPPAPRATPYEEQFYKEQGLRLQTAAIYMKSIKSSLRDPDSLQWESAKADFKAEVVCLEYRARNGFGGMNRSFVVVTAERAWVEDVRAWNKRCTGMMYDVSAADKQI